MSTRKKSNVKVLANQKVVEIGTKKNEGQAARLRSFQSHNHPTKKGGKTKRRSKARVRGDWWSIVMKN